MNNGLPLKKRFSLNTSHTRLMETIQMVDLKNQYLKIKSEIDAEISKVLHSSAFINGPAVKEFQTALEEYLSVKHVIPCANGTDALQVSLMALDLQPGDEVITTPFTFFATAEVLALLKLTPVFVDVEENSFNINANRIEEAITDKTKAILPVHLFGQCADMEKITSLAAKYNLFVIEDACQAIGADFIFSNGKRKKAGTIGDVGCVSFFPSKNLGCYGDGGAIFTDNDELAQRLRGIVNHGMFTRYYHDMIGVNSRLDTIQAAILKVKLPYLNDYNQARQQVAKYYNQAFASHKNIITPYQTDNSTHIFHQYTLRLLGKNRENIIKKMAEKGIPVMIYYPVPLHLQKAFSYLGIKTGELPISERLCNEVLSLPIHTEMSEEQLAYITRTFLSLL
ncbi:MAG TPA: DegT/DnrJ/EryC1/StrS family aminotransferase [Bacteroidales bacterium]|nr:DegT/DnrJ/EryC1/StrS family aminotransferase [Bacteroidales bacterium]